MQVPPTASAQEHSTRSRTDETAAILHRRNFIRKRMSSVKAVEQLEFASDEIVGDGRPERRRRRFVAAVLRSDAMSSFSL